MTKVCFLGNCQAQLLETMVRIADPSIAVERFKPVFLMTAEDHEPTYAAMKRADIVFAQRIAQEFGKSWLASAEVRATFGAKTIVWPNIYFDGIFPGIQYIYMGRGEKLVGPLGDYHFSQIARCFETGESVEAALDAFVGERLFQIFPDPIGESLQRLRERESDADLVISDHIEARYADDRCFYTPNHPTNETIGEMLRRMAGRAGLRLDVEKAVKGPYRLDEVYVAASRAITRKLRLPYDPEPSYLGREVLGIEGLKVSLGKPKRYTPEDLTAAYYDVYRRVGYGARK
jgi:hypothetical protein